MAISYNRMWKLLVDKKMSKADLRKAADIAPNTMTKLRRDEPVNLAILGRICKVLKYHLWICCCSKAYNSREKSSAVYSFLKSVDCTCLV